MKKIIALMVSIVLLATTMLTAIPVYAANSLNLTVTVETAGAFEKGIVPITFTIANNQTDAITLKSIEKVNGSNFTFDSIATNQIIAPGGIESVTKSVVYDGGGRNIKYKITDTSGKIYENTITVENAIPNTVVTPPPSDTTYKAEVYVSSLSTKILTAGSKVPFLFDIEQTNANNIRVKVEGDGENASMFSLDTSTGWDTISSEQSKQRNLRVSSKLKDGAYKLNFVFTYTCNGQPETKTDSVLVYVRGDNSARPYIKSTAFNKAEIGTDNKAKMTAKVANPTPFPVSDIRVGINPELSPGFSLYENFQPATIGALDGLEIADAVFSIYVNSTVVTGNYLMVFDISYKESDGKLCTVQEPVYVQVTRSADANGGAAGTGGKPRIIISKYAVDVKSIKAGQLFTLDFTLENTSASKSVSNIKVVVDSAQATPTGATAGASGGAVFFPAEGSNSFFFETIAPKKSVSKKIKLMARQDVEPGVYPVILNLEYDSNGAAQITSAENISFPVSQEQRLDITGFSIPTEVMGGQMLPVNFQYINKGKATIYNFSINVEGDFTLDGGDVYIGNLTAGYNDFYESMLLPSGEGQMSGVLVLKYEDSQGQLQEQRKEFSTLVMPMEQGGKGTDGGFNEGVDPVTGLPIVQPKKSGGLIWFIIGGVIVLAGAGAGTFIIIRKKRKAKEGLMQNEED